VILVAASFVALALLIGLSSKYRFVKRITATSKVIIIGGEHKGMKGTLSATQIELELGKRYHVEL
jgi:hypothetical protein